MSQVVTIHQHKEQRFSPAGLPVAHIRLDRLRANWRHIYSLAGGDDDAAGAWPAASAWPALMAVIKADAYGHGLEQSALALAEEGARAFAVGSVAEGVLLRRILNDADTRMPHLSHRPRILALLGLQTPEEARDIIAHDLIPLAHSKAQLDLLAAACNGRPTGEKPLPVAIKIDTGMSRLGFASGEPAALAALLRSYPALEPAMLISHLAAADDPAAIGSARRQMDRFRAVFESLRTHWPDIVPSFANSPGTLIEKELAAGFAFHVRRPGFVLYGGNPFAGTEKAGLGQALLPVMEVTAPVLAVHDLAQGETVSYGRTFTAPRGMRVATIGAGYADGFSRGLSGKGFVCLRGIRCPILGRVCMQMHIVDASRLPDLAAGENAYLLGGEGPGSISPDELAAAWGTIPYEVFCLLGRNARVFYD